MNNEHPAHLTHGGFDAAPQWVFRSLADLALDRGRLARLGVADGADAEGSGARMTIQGFEYEGKQIKFMEPQGKDIGFPRWRITLYYTVNLAKTHFELTEDDYNRFLRIHAPLCYADYRTFRNAEGPEWMRPS